MSTTWRATSAGPYATDVILVAGAKERVGWGAWGLAKNIILFSYLVQSPLGAVGSQPLHQPASLASCKVDMSALQWV